MHLGEDGEEAGGGGDARNGDGVDVVWVYEEGKELVRYAWCELFVYGNVIGDCALPCPVVHVEILDVERRQVWVLNGTGVDPEVVYWESVDDIPPFCVDVDAVP
jgi:hypothetical protein